jgi:uncharacterized protein (DUF952 family)
LTKPARYLYGIISGFGSVGKRQSEKMKSIAVAITRAHQMTGPEPTNDVLIYKICPAAAWAEAETTGVYRGSSDDLRDGYIHFSTATQIEGTLAKHYTGQRGLELLAVPVAAVAGDLRFEESRGGALFPHLYNVLPAASVLWHAPITLGADGMHILPDLTEPDASA